MYNDEFEDHYYNKKSSYSQKIKQFDSYSLFQEIKNLNMVFSSLLKEQEEYFNYHTKKRLLHDKESYNKDYFDFESSEDEVFHKEYSFIEKRLEQSLAEGIDRLKRDPGLLPYLLKAVPFNKKNSDQHIYDFFILDKAIHNIKDFTLLNEAILENYSRLDNYSYVTFFENCLDNSTLAEIDQCADYFLDVQSYLNVNLRDKMIFSLIKKIPVLFNSIPNFLKDSNYFKKSILQKDVITDFESFMAAEKFLDKNSHNFLLNNIKMIDTQNFLTNFIKTYFPKEMDNIEFIIESSKNNKSVANNLARNIKNNHKIFNSIENINKILDIEARFAHKVPEDFWNNKSNLIKVISSNINVYHESPEKIKNDLLFCLEMQFLAPQKNIFLNHWKFKNISHSQAVDGINLIIEKNNEIINVVNDVLKNDDDAWNKKQKIITNYQAIVHFESLCLLMSRLDGNQLKNKEYAEFRTNIWEAFHSLNESIDYDKKSKPSKDIINPLFLLAYYPKDELKDTLIHFSAMDILSSLSKFKIPEDNKNYLLDALDENILGANNNKKSNYSISFILSQFKSEWFNPVEKRAPLNDIYHVLAIIPANHLQDILKPDLLDYYQKRNLLSNFPELNKNNPLEEILTKILEIQIYNDIKKQPVAPKGKVLKF